MESSLHRELKHIYAGADASTEVKLGDYRIDALGDGELIEIQHGSLAAIRDKMQQLLRDHRVLLVKPIVARKTLVKLRRRGGPVTDRRLSPKRGKPVDIFHELIYFTRVFPHPNLVLEVPLVQVEEWRYPGHGRRRRHRKSDFVVEDQRLVSIEQTLRYRTAADLLALLPAPLAAPFDTQQLASRMGVPRWVAQQAAYCLRHTGALTCVGKRGNARLYAVAATAGTRKASPAA